MSLPTLTEITADDVQSVLNVDEHAETVTFFPSIGGARSIVVTVEPAEAFLEDDYSIGSRETIIVFAAKDMTASSGGIDVPRLGDALLRSESLDPLQQRYAWDGVIAGSWHGFWRLQFSRVRVVQAGLAGRPSK